jgi:hypothetical protein
MAKEVDGPASEALKVILFGDLSRMVSRLRIAWTRFLLSLLFRTPQMVNLITKEAERNLRDSFQKNPEEYETLRTDAHPPTLVEWVESQSPHLFTEVGKSFLPGIIESPKLGNAIMEMQWAISTLKNKISDLDLLTSDNPIFRVHGLGDPNCVIALPISPHKAFFAARNAATLNHVFAHGPARVAGELNASMANQAEKYVYGLDDHHLCFVENRLRRSCVPEDTAAASETTGARKRGRK